MPENVLTYELVKKAVDRFYSMPLYRDPYIKVKVYHCEYVMCHKCRHIFSYEKKNGVCDVCGKTWGADEESTHLFMFSSEDGDHNG